MSLKLAIYGYDSDIGRLVIETLDEQGIEFTDVYPLSPLGGEYDAVKIGKNNYFVAPIDEFDFAKADVALFLTTQDESQRWVDTAREKGCIVVDNSHLFSGDGKTVTIVPELNPFDVKKAVESRLCIPALAPSVQLSLALSVLHDEYGVAKASVTSLESASEYGRLGTETLAHETTLLLNGMSGEHQGFPAQLAFNLHTKMGSTQENGSTDHENAIAKEVLQLLGRFERGFELTCILVPVFYGHTMVVNVELEDRSSLEQMRELIDKSDLLTLFNDDEVLTPVTDIINERTVMVSRLRENGSTGKSFSFVLMMDNTRRGEAISIVEITKLLDRQL
ncbi:MAG: Asd/ArgC dimerization domain-containing protein [Succinivibrio sp.]